MHLVIIWRIHRCAHIYLSSWAFDTLVSEEMAFSRSGFTYRRTRQRPCMLKPRPIQQTNTKKWLNIGISLENGCVPRHGMNQQAAEIGRKGWDKTPPGDGRFLSASAATLLLLLLQQSAWGSLGLLLWPGRWTGLKRVWSGPSLPWGSVTKRPGKREWARRGQRWGPL
jgi:hypothetical protein